jgi:hypothetical protein
MSEAMNRIETSEGMVLGGSPAVPKTGIVVAGALVTMEAIVLKVNDLMHGQLQCWSSVDSWQRRYPNRWCNRRAGYAQGDSRSTNLADQAPTHSCPRSLRHRSGASALAREVLQSSYHVRDSITLVSSASWFPHVAAPRLLRQKTKYMMGR